MLDSFQLNTPFITWKNIIHGDSDPEDLEMYSCFRRKNLTQEIFRKIRPKNAENGLTDVFRFCSKSALRIFLITGYD